MAFTSGKSNAGTDDRKCIQLVVDGQPKLKTLPNLKGNDYQSNKGDLWKLSLKDFFGFTNCTKARDIEEISIVNAGSNGWNIDSIVTFAVHDKHTYQLSSVNLDVFRWVDSDNAYEKVFPLTLTL